jgi:hypothetical protein
MLPHSSLKLLDASLKSQLDMFQLWLSKQCIGICATRKNIKCIQDLLNDKCPNCNHPRETSNHLNRCPKAGQTLLFQDSMAALTEWMKDHNQTDAELAYWIEKYLIFQGTWSFTSLLNAGGGGSSQILTAAASQDLIGWIEFLHGKVSKEIGCIQEVHCTLSPCRITGTDWMKLLVTHLIQISLSQWILRDFTLHNSNTDIYTGSNIGTYYGRSIPYWIPLLKRCQKEAGISWSWTF